MRELADYHHFRTERILPSDRVARCERRVIDLLLSGLPDSQRESSVAFELKHHHSVAQFGRVLGRKRGLPVDLCTVGCLLHDIHVIVHGSYTDHAHLGAPLALDVLSETGRYCDAERDAIYSLVYDHSDKHVRSDDMWQEFGKDADVLDCFLYPGAFDYYLKHKSLGVFYYYLERARSVWAEIGMPADPRFELLKGFRSPWLGVQRQVAKDVALVFARAACDGAVSDGTGEIDACPPFLLVPCDGDVQVWLDADLWLEVEAWRDLLGDLAAEDGPVKCGAPDEVAGALSRVEAQGGGVLVWPALDGYEVMDPEDRRWVEFAGEPARRLMSA